MRRLGWPALALLCLACSSLPAQQRDAHIGYAYPAGGRAGTTFTVVVGGQYLRGVRGAVFAGQGITSKFVEHANPLSQNNKSDARRYIGQLQAYRRQLANKVANPTKPERPTERPLPDHPWLRDMETMSDDELVELSRRLNNPKEQPNAQIGELVWLEVTIDPKAVPGDRELRLETPTGLTNPVVFQIDSLPEYNEAEAVGDKPAVKVVLDTPVLCNGQILPGDVDSFYFRAKKGQRLTLHARARHLVPYLADAVPGWFQATLALYDQYRRELAFVDDYAFDPDPVLLFEVPQTGEYEVEIRDSIYRGREDFVYRIAITDQPFILSMFPLGGRIGSELTTTVGGWNVPETHLTLNTRAGDDPVRLTSLQGSRQSNEVPYELGHLPEVLEQEPNNREKDAQAIQVPVVVNGRILQAGDVDWFKFQGRAGHAFVAEVTARRLRTPVDSLVRLIDEQGKILAWNDDYQDPASGLVTHHADSYLTATLPADGTYYVQMSDAQSHGGDAYAYRLRVGPPQPDFALRSVPSSLTMGAGRVAVIEVHAVRKDGFDGDVEITLADAPDGFKLSGGWLPRGMDRVRMTVTAPTRAPQQVVALHLEGRASVDGRTLVRRVVPADDQMQAFAYRHLVPAQEFAVLVTPSRINAPAGEVAGMLPLKVPAGGTVNAKIALGAKPNINGVTFTLSEPPDGVTIGAAEVLADGLAFPIKVSRTAEPGYADNLLIEVFMTVGGRRTSIGFVPAIPFEVVKP